VSAPESKPGALRRKNLLSEKSFNINAGWSIKMLSSERAFYAINATVC